MSIVRDLMKASGHSAPLNLSKEELEELEDEVLDVVEDESDDIDDELEEVEQVDEAATSLEALADYVDGLTGLSQEGYTQLVNVANGILGAARVYNAEQMMVFSAEDGEAATDEERKATAGSSFRQKAGALKDAGVEAMKRLWRVIADFFNKFFDRIERVKGAAAGKAAKFGNGEGGELRVNNAWAKQYTKMGELATVSKSIGQKCVQAVSHIKVGGNAAEGASKLASIAHTSLPSGLIGNPTFDSATGALKYELPKNDGAGFSRLAPAAGKAALDAVVGICDDILRQRQALRGTALTEQEKRMSAAFGAGGAAEQLSGALKLVNSVYKGWCSYVGRVCMGIVGGIGANGAEDQTA